MLNSQQHAFNRPPVRASGVPVPLYAIEARQEHGFPKVFAELVRVLIWRAKAFGVWQGTIQL